MLADDLEWDSSSTTNNVVDDYSPLSPKQNNIAHDYSSLSPKPNNIGHAYSSVSSNDVDNYSSLSPKQSNGADDYSSLSPMKSTVVDDDDYSSLSPKLTAAEPPSLFDNNTTQLNTQPILYNFSCAVKTNPAQLWYKDEHVKTNMLLFVFHVFNHSLPICREDKSNTIDEADFKNIHFQVNIVREDTGELIREKILKVHFIDFMAGGLVSIRFRITDVCRNYNKSKFVIVVSPQHTTAAYTMQQVVSTPIEVRSKRPNKLTTFTGVSEIVVRRKKKTRQAPKWLLPWALKANSLIQEQQWQVVGYSYVNNVIDYQHPIRRCIVCCGFEEQGHRAKCELRALLHMFKEEHIRTIDKNMNETKTKKRKR